MRGRTPAAIGVAVLAVGLAAFLWVSRDAGNGTLPPRPPDQVPGISIDVAVHVPDDGALGWLEMDIVNDAAPGNELVTVTGASRPDATFGPGLGDPDRPGQVAGTALIVLPPDGGVVVDMGSAALEEPARQDLQEVYDGSPLDTSRGRADPGRRSVPSGENPLLPGERTTVFAVVSPWSHSSATPTGSLADLRAAAVVRVGLQGRVPDPDGGVAAAPPEPLTCVDVGPTLEG